MHGSFRLCLLALAVTVGVATVVVAADASPAPGSSPEGPGAKQRPGSFEQARQRYENDLQRPSLFIRTRSAVYMAAFRDPRGFDLLQQRYTRPNDEPHDHVRYTTATILGQYYGGDADFSEKWAALLGQPARDADSWLWYNGQRARARHGHTEAIIESIRNSRNQFLRAATIEALAVANRGEVLELIVEILSDRRMPRGVERSVLVEACASALYRLRHELGSDRFTAAAELVIHQLDERRTERRTKLVIARHLKALFNEPEAWDDAASWLRILRRGTINQEGGGGQSGVQFMNVPAVGERLAFVIDFSDSMLEPLSENEREELRGPTSGGGQREAEEDGLPWDRITNRFELAREELKRSLRGLPESVHFCVIVYGTEVKLLNSTPFLVPASQRMVRAVITELDSYRVGPPEPSTGRHHGTLLGNTNIHGALMKAFQVTSRVAIESEEHVAAIGFQQGVDTIFHLSDGTPSWDNFAATDVRDPQDRVGDPETGVRGPDDATHLIYRGPYGRRDLPTNFLVEDVRRMNLHRKVEIHNIGIGEADVRLLDQLSAIGMGTSRFVGGNDGRRRR